MRRIGWIMLALWGTMSLASAQELPMELLALDRQIQQAVGKVDRGVVTVVVGRSEHYPAPDEKNPGALGRYDAPDLLSKVPAEDRTSRLRILDLDLSARDHVPEATSTGLILDPAGLILVPARAVARARKLYVHLPGGQGSFADIHALDPRSDLAVLKLLDPPQGLVTAPLGDGGAVNKGQLVLLLAQSPAPGFREGSATASWGMVANIRRRLPGPREEADRTRSTLHHYGTLLEVNSPLNPPTSGGVVLNLRGEVIGMQLAHVGLRGPDVPGGFVIPFDAGMRRIIDVLRKGQEVEYGFLGVRLRANDLPGRGGVQISDVTEGSPASRSRLGPNDTIVRIDGQPINDRDDLFLVVGTRLAGSTVEVEYLRLGDRVPRKTQVTLAKYWVQTPSIASQRPTPIPGLQVDWSSVLSQRTDGGPLKAGVVVREIDPKSPVGQTDLRLDDLITQVGNAPVTTPAEFHKAVTATPGKIELTYYRDGELKQVTVPR